ncbi:hypothetical protein C7437_1089 [Psychrobacillus insolitus]|uniref:Uncharacterized protein n=1 Tax=Psychrobacillus insolitus TaxID=1461 RepID=A0A2W7N2X8_9BACI|nr:hypothetical protein [Psychrobacillus insolitus]PZX02914.1 hypothetical protein C7437_1089 [Psychrobacillus insolitus]
MESYETEQREGLQNNAISKTVSEISVGEWLISMLIMIIPIVNIVMLFIWGFGSPDPRRNYARASLIWMAICIGLAVLFYGVVIALFFTVGGY